MKHCIRCKTSKETTEFHKDAGRNDGMFPYCKDCRREIKGSKKLEHNIVGYLDGHMVTLNKKQYYPTIVGVKGRPQLRVHVYVAEKKISRRLKKDEVVHHIDGNKLNWNEDNIAIINKHLHMRFEGHKQMGFMRKLFCTTCGKSKKYSNHTIGRGIIPERYQCARCYYASGGPGGRSKLLKVSQDDIVLAVRNSLSKYGETYKVLEKE